MVRLAEELACLPQYLIVKWHLWRDACAALAMRGAVRVGKPMRKITSVLLCGAALTILPIGGAGAASLQIVGGTPFNLNEYFNPGGWSNPDGIGVGTTIQTFNSANASTGGLEINPSIAGPAVVTLDFT